jgi:hypothetical protein
MVSVIIEQSYDKPIDLDAIFAGAGAMRWCLDTCRASAHFHALTSEGLNSVCVYEAPDAEALRNVERTSGVREAQRIWAATVHPGPGDDPDKRPALEAGEATFGIVERCFSEPIEFDSAQAVENSNASCFVLHRVRFIRSYLALDKRKMLCLYAAPDLESIRTANRMTGLPCEEVYLAKPSPA